MIKTANPTTPALDAAIDAIIAYAATLDDLNDIDFLDILESLDPAATLDPANDPDPIMHALMLAATLIHRASPFADRDLDELIDYRAYFAIINR